MFGRHEAPECIRGVQGSLGGFGVDSHEDTYHVPWENDGRRHLAGN